MSQWSTLDFTTMRRFNLKYGLGPETRLFGRLPVTKEDIVLYRITSNYERHVPADKVDALMDELEEVFGKHGKWYISDDNESFSGNYKISLPPKSEDTEASTSEEGR
ncbi:hypothetical protein E1B28_005171 [Marasmius oreades]|uniref:Uncharacterized protein n=1 Tax=Marasmius oreades TaxID=181124 RepID=A0A9P8ADQ7_9AGAR|nr:uncharacterized protein E1B28_005171 [Marasmius oreades]KAG7097859.1 hypothetical protein E1B28_005171 [Marasmius oreades]